VAIRNVSAAKNSPDCVCGRGSAPNPSGGAYDAPPDPLVGWGWGCPLPIPHSRRPWMAPPLTAPVLFMKSRRLWLLVLLIRDGVLEAMALASRRLEDNWSWPWPWGPSPWPWPRMSCPCIGLGKHVLGLDHFRLMCLVLCTLY